MFLTNPKRKVPLLALPHHRKGGGTQEATGRVRGQREGELWLPQEEAGEAGKQA